MPLIGRWHWEPKLGGVSRKQERWIPGLKSDFLGGLGYTRSKVGHESHDATNPFRFFRGFSLLDNPKRNASKRVYRLFLSSTALLCTTVCLRCKGFFKRRPPLIGPSHDAGVASCALHFHIQLQGGFRRAAKAERSRVGFWMRDSIRNIVRFVRLTTSVTAILDASLVNIDHLCELVRHSHSSWSRDACSCESECDTASVPAYGILPGWG